MQRKKKGMDQKEEKQEIINERESSNYIGMIPFITGMEPGREEE